MFDRRFVLLSGLAACSLPAEQDGNAAAAAQTNPRRAPAPARGPALSPERFGARGDGRSDDTDALQACVDAARQGGIVRLRRGAVYRIDSNRNPTWLSFGGLQLRAGVTLDLNGAELKALPSSQSRGAVVQAPRVDNWRIIGPGRINGERAEHRGRDGEWGMGIFAFGGRGWVIGPGVEVADCWGDGICLGPMERPGHFCEDFLITGVRVSRCRRNGITVSGGRNGRIEDFQIETIRGVSPEGAIDFEPDHREHPNRNIVVSNGTARNCSVGVYVTVANENIRIEGMTIDVSNSGIIIGDHVTGLTIENNPRIHSSTGGDEGGAIRTVVNSPPTVSNLMIRNNVLSGGGFFALEFAGRGHRGVTITGNRIVASNRGTLGIGRLVDVTFTNNDCLVSGEAGRANEAFGHFSGVTRGRNRYRNATPHRMHLVVFGGRDQGGENFIGPNLRPWVER